MRLGGALRRALAVAVLAAAGAAAIAVARVGSASPAATPATATLAKDRAAPREVEPTRYLRQLSFDLRGGPPAMDELDRVAREGRVSDAAIDAMLDSDAFVAQVRAWHAAMLWPNVDALVRTGFPLVASDAKGSFSPYPELVVHPDLHPDAVVYRGSIEPKPCDAKVEYPELPASGPAPTYAVVGSDGVRRAFPYYDADGVVLPYHDAEHCPNLCSKKTEAERRAPSYRLDEHDYHAMDAPGADAHPDALDPPGEHCPAAFPNRVVNACGVGPARVEDVYMQRAYGFVWKTTYWTQGARVRVCARDAQSRVVGIGTTETCGVEGGHPTCGCGPDGVFCVPSAPGLPARVGRDVHEAIDREPLEIVAQVVARDEDYFDAFTTRRSFVTGPLAAYFKTLEPRDFADPRPPAAPSQIPDVPFGDETWHEYVRGPEHSGVLTTMAYLLRFPTGRSRVSQFRSQFMCRPFTPATPALPGADDPCTSEANLAHRCGCKNCHAAIEPMTAWFGRWGERTARYLAPSEFPAFDPSCTACVAAHSCSGRCVAYQIDTVGAESDRFAGMLRGYLYRAPDELARIDEGPRGLVETAIASGELESCTVKTAWRNLVGRAMTGDELRDRLPDFERGFEAAHRSYRALVRAIVTSPEYRRVE